MTYTMDASVSGQLGTLLHDQITGSYGMIIIAVGIAGGLWVTYKLVNRLFSAFHWFDEEPTYSQKEAEQFDVRYNETLTSHEGDPFIAQRAELAEKVRLGELREQLNAGKMSIEDYRDLANNKPIGFFRQKEEAQGEALVK